MYITCFLQWRLEGCVWAVYIVTQLEGFDLYFPSLLESIEAHTV